MSQDESTAIAELREIVARGQSLDNDALEALFAEISEETVHAIETGDRMRLVALRRELRRPYSLLAVREDEEVEETLAFVLGRIAGLLELADSAVRRQRPASFGRELSNQRTFEILELLRDKEMASSELTERLGIDKSAVSRRLQKLEAAGLIIRQRSGRRLYSRLTPAAQQAIDEVPAGDRNLRQVIDQLQETREAIVSGYRDLVSREHAWRAFQRLVADTLWDAVKDLENDPYRQQLADVLDAAIAKLQAFQLEEKHLSAIDLTLSCLAAEEVTEEDLDTCESAWQAADTNTLPSLGEGTVEWMRGIQIPDENRRVPARAPS